MPSQVEKMAEPIVTVTPVNVTLRAWLRTLGREGFGLVALLFLIIAILGPISTVFLWAFTERWRYPSLLPTEWGIKYQRR